MLSDFVTSKTINALTLTANTPVPVWIPASGKRFVLQGVVLSASAATNVQILDGTVLVAIIPLAAGGPLFIPFGEQTGIQAANVGNVLNIQSAVAATLSGTIYGDEI